MEKKYELTYDVIYHNGKTLHGIRAMKSFDYVAKGDLGGWIESENNLSHNADCWVYGNAEVYGNANVCDNADYIVFKNFWSSGRYFTWTRSDNMWAVGCFHGTGEELIKKAYADSEKYGREYERVVRYVESILVDEREEENKKYK